MNHEGDLSVIRYRVVFFCGWVLLFLAVTSGSIRAEGEYPIMRPDVDTFHAWLGSYNSAPEAAMDPMADLRIAADAVAGIGGGYSLLDNLVYTPTERKQGSCGNCWVWVGTGLLELALAKTGINERLSIQLFDSCARLSCDESACGADASCACAGGDLEMFVAAYNALGYVVPWSNSGAYYQDGGIEGDCGTTVACAGIEKNPNYVFGNVIAQNKIATANVDQGTAIGRIKNVLQQGKGVYFIFTLPNTSAWDDFYDFWKGGSKTDLWDFSAYAGMDLDFIDGAGSHVVLLVGYNEVDVERANHYWIALNSWGTTTRRADGTFRIKMYQDYGAAYSYSYEGKAYTSPVMQFETINDVSFEEGPATDPYEDIQISAGPYSGTIAITAGAASAWTAAFDADWIRITSSAAGFGDGQITFSVSANTGTAARTARLYVNGALTIKVIQEGAVSQEATAKTVSKAASSEGDGGMCFISVLGVS